jgi:hypothetical protein
MLNEAYCVFNKRNDSNWHISDDQMHQYKEQGTRKDALWMTKLNCLPHESLKNVNFYSNFQHKIRQNPRIWKK